MKKGTVSILIMLLMISVIAIGCSSGEQSSQDNVGSTPQEKEGTKEVAQEEIEEVKLVMYSWRPEDREAYEKIFAEFNKENPHITIVFEPFKSTEYNTILTNSLVGGSGPDIVQLRSYEGIKSIADNDYLVPLNDLPGINEINADFVNSARGSDGNVYGVPLALNAGVIWYNKALFEKHSLDVPETWDELIAVSKEFKNNGVIPIAQGGRAAYLLSMLHSVISPSGYGGNDFVNDLTSGNADLLDSRFIESIERVQELEEYFPKDFIALDDKDAQRFFYMEEAAMYINGNYRLGTFESNVPDMDIGVIPGLAIEKGGEAPVSTWVDGSYGVVKNSKNQEAGLKFIEFMASKKFGQMFSDELNTLSAISGVEPQHPTLLTLTEAIESSSTPYLMLVHFGKGSPTGKTEFENALQGLYLDQISVQEVAQKTKDTVDRAE